MRQNLLHIYRNTPIGRETLMHSVYFCKMLDIELNIYIPDTVRFKMKFRDNSVQVDLDSSYLFDPESAVERARALAAEAEIQPKFINSSVRGASKRPNLETQFAFMCCPRSVSDPSSKIGLGYIGAKVRRIIRTAPFPVLMTSPVFKPWESIAVLFGGSRNSINALRSGIQISERSGVPLDLFIQLEHDRKYYDLEIHNAGLDKAVERYCRYCYLFSEEEFAENLYSIPHNALVLSGAYGHGLINNFLFGSKMEIAQATLSNCMLVTGPKTTSILH